MIWLSVVLLVVIIGAAAVVIAGRGDAMTDVYEDRPDVTIDRGPLTADDLANVRFTTAVRGYRMDEVDAFVDRLKAELESRSRPIPTVHDQEANVASEQAPQRWVRGSLVSRVVGIPLRRGASMRRRNETLTAEESTSTKDSEGLSP